MLLAFLGFVVVLSGFVAYAADTIARRVGRRHLRLFGLRPKTTALIVAVASGMGISLLSVLAFGLLNRQALINLAQAESVRQQLAQLQKSVQSTQGELGAVRTQRDAAQAQARALEAQRQQAVKARDEASAESAIANSLRDQAVSSRDELYRQAQALSEQEQAVAALRDKLLVQVGASQQDLSRTQAQAAQLAAQVKSTQARLASAQSQLNKTQDQLQSTQAQLKTAQAQTSQYQAQVKSLTASRAALEARVSSAQAQMNSAQAQAQQATARASAATKQAQQADAQFQAVQGQLATLKASVASLQGTRNSLQSQRDRLTRDLNSLKAVRDSLQRNNATLQQGLNAAVAERDRLQADVQNVTGELSATRSGGLAYRRGELVYSGVVASVGNLPAALSQANLAAQARRVTTAALSPDDLMGLQAKLRGLNASALVSCRAAANTAPGYPLQLACDAVANRILYHQGDVIRSASVSLGGNTEAVRVQLLNLESGVLRDLSSRGVPPERVNDPDLSTNALYDLVAQRQNSADKPQNVTVSILAASDLRPGSPVQLSATVK